MIFCNSIAENGKEKKRMEKIPENLQKRRKLKSFCRDSSFLCFLDEEIRVYAFSVRVVRRNMAMAVPQMMA